MILLAKACRKQPLKATRRCDVALQLRFKMSLSCYRLVGSSPDRPCDDMGGVDLALREPDGDPADFLNRPADQFALRRFVAAPDLVFLQPTPGLQGIGLMADGCH